MKYQATEDLARAAAQNAAANNWNLNEALEEHLNEALEEASPKNVADVVWLAMGASGNPEEFAAGMLERIRELQARLEKTGSLLRQ